MQFKICINLLKNHITIFNHNDIHQSRVKFHVSNPEALCSANGLAMNIKALLDKDIGQCSLHENYVCAMRMKKMTILMVS